MGHINIYLEVLRQVQDTYDGHKNTSHVRKEVEIYRIIRNSAVIILKLM